jgi:glycosyltransferase involved in cell wall biosynthesis
MKILQVLCGSAWGGGGVVVVPICRALLERGDEVWVLCADDETASRFGGAGARVVRSPLWTRSIQPLDVVPLLHIYRLCRRERFDLVATHTSKGGFLGRMAARAAGVPHVVYHAHAYYFNHMRPGLQKSLWVALERFAARFGDLTLTVSDEHRQGALACSVEAPARIRTVLNGIDLSPFTGIDGRAARAQLGYAPDDVLIGAVGRLQVFKGFEFLIRGLPPVLAEFPRARLLLCGSGPLEAQLRAECAQAGVTDRVDFLGFRSDIPQVMAALDLFVQPSLREGLSIALIEAAAAGLPSVACAIAGNAEIVQHGHTGLLVPPADPAALGAALRSLLEAPETARAMGREARRRAEARFTVERMVAEHLAAYDSLLGPGDRGGLPGPRDGVRILLEEDSPRLP